jgi:hypothetical protein
MTGTRGWGPVQLLVYRFGAGAAYEGRLVGALERMESGGTLRIVEALFITHDADTGELEAIDLRSRGAGSLVSPLVGFRLDASERRRATQRALRADGDADGVTLRDIGAALAPGAAIAAVLVEHTWARALEDAVTQSGGTAVAGEFVDAATLADVAPRRRAAAAAA